MKTQLKVLITFLTLALFLNNISYSQVGGGSTYEFLNLTNSARIAAMGGNFLAIKDNDITLTVTNPSLITDKMHDHLAFSFVDYFADINYGFVTYSRTFKKLGSFTAGIQYIDYGTFVRANDFGYKYGEFIVTEDAFHIGWARQLDSNFSIGANLKAIYSALESYYSFGLAVDIAASYYNSENNFTASFIARNIGRQISYYTDGNREPLPFELQLGISKRLEHVPFRYSILIRHLEKFDLTYDDPNDDDEKFDPLTGEPIPEKKFEEIADKVMRHIIIGGEFMLSKNFGLRFGYNYQRRKELKVNSKVSTVGFSWGMGFKISKFHLSYSRATYHLVGSPNFMTITTNLSDYYSKRNK